MLSRLRIREQVGLVGALVLVGGAALAAVLVTGALEVERAARHMQHAQQLTRLSANTHVALVHADRAARLPDTGTGNAPAPGTYDRHMNALRTHVMALGEALTEPQLRNRLSAFKDKVRSYDEAYSNLRDVRGRIGPPYGSGALGTLYQAHQRLLALSPQLDEPLAVVVGTLAEAALVPECPAWSATTRVDLAAESLRERMEAGNLAGGTRTAMERRLASFLEAYDALKELCARRSAQNAALAATFASLESELHGITGPLATMNRRAAEKLNTARRRMLWTWLGLGGLTVLAVLAAVLWIGGHIARRVSTMAGIMRRIARGDTRVPIPARGDRDEVGSMAEAMEVFRDTTAALHRSEAMLRAVIEGIGEAVIVKDREQRFLLLNRRAEQHVQHVRGVTPPLQGRHESEVLPPGEASYIAEVDRRVMARRIPETHNADVEHDGQIRNYVTTVNVFEGADGEVEGVVSVFRDITEQVRMAEELRQAQKMEVVGKLTGGVAHDFNNLLAVMLGNLELLEESLQHDPDLASQARAALEAGERGAELTRRLLAFARRQALAPQPTDVNRLISDMTALLRRTLGATIEIETVLAGGLWRAHIDPGQLETALLNLAVNARDAMPAGGKVTIESANAHLDDEYATQHEEVYSGRYVLVAVTDTGPGMGQEVMEHAFEPFYTTKEVGHGSGLGLSMVYGFVKQSGGHIKLYSEVGRGTTVKLYLPKAPDNAPAPPRRRESTHEPRGDGECVLVVEDDPDVRAYTVRLLEELSYATLAAADAEEALRELQQHPEVACLLTDVVLPGGTNGAVLARQATSLRPGLRVLYMSGYTENAIIHHGTLDEGVQLIGKPFRRGELARKLAQVFATPPPEPGEGAGGEER